MIGFDAHTIPVATTRPAGQFRPLAANVGVFSPEYLRQGSTHPFAWLFVSLTYDCSRTKSAPVLPD